jgi:hypothetical protein
MSYSHKRIRRFSLQGEIFDDSHILRLKDQYIFMLISGMRNKGYVPRYDIDTDFTISYNGKTFEFELSVYGVYIGKDKAKCVLGIDKNNPIVSNIIQKIKSEEAS